MIELFIDYRYVFIVLIKHASTNCTLTFIICYRIRQQRNVNLVSAEQTTKKMVRNKITRISIINSFVKQANTPKHTQYTT